jgi:murein DD-endopeptidase MepM/ murein hydrolase activator NlpD
MPVIMAALLAAQTVAPAPAIRLAVDARALQPGELVVLTVTTSTPVTSMRGRGFDRPLAPWRVDDTTWRALIGIDLDVAPGTYDVTVETGPAAAPTRARRRLVVTAKQFPTRRLTVNPDFVDPPATVLARIEAEAKRISAIWQSSAPSPLWSGIFMSPVPERANSAFGTRSIFNGQARSPHGGADFPSPEGTAVRAPNAGRVVLAGDLYYTGRTVAIDHGLGLVSLFAHLSAIDVLEGASVTPGQVLGRVGSTGRVTGAHLHWTVRAGGARIDPLSLVAVLGPDRDKTPGALSGDVPGK